MMYALRFLQPTYFENFSQYSDVVCLFSMKMDPFISVKQWENTKNLSKYFQWVRTFSFIHAHLFTQEKRIAAYAKIIKLKRCIINYLVLLYSSISLNIPSTIFLNWISPEKVLYNDPLNTNLVLDWQQQNIWLLHTELLIR